MAAVAGAHPGPGPPPRYITARLRPAAAPDGVSDPLAHPLFSARREAPRGVLVRVATTTTTREAPSGGGAAAAAAAAAAAPSITAVAAITAAFHFPGLADAQYAAWDGRPAGAQAGRAAGAGAHHPPPRPPFLPGEPFLCVPPAWARTDVPALAPGALLSDNTDTAATPGWPVPGPAPPAVPWHAAIAPPPVEGGAPALVAAVVAAAGVTPARPPPPDPVALVTSLVSTFEARPAWAPAALEAALLGGGGEPRGGGGGGAPPAPSLPALAPALARLSYRFSSGPWAGLAVRRGYDPRADDRSRAWQGVANGAEGTVRQLCDLAEAGDAAAVRALEGGASERCDAVAGWCEAGAWAAVVAGRE